MLTALIAPVTSLLVSASTSVAIDNAVKIITPPNVKAVTSFGIKVGTIIIGGIIAGKIADYTVKNVEAVIETVKNTGVEENSTQEEN